MIQYVIKSAGTEPNTGPTIKTRISYTLLHLLLYPLLHSSVYELLHSLPDSILHQLLHPVNLQVGGSNHNSSIPNQY